MAVSAIVTAGEDEFGRPVLLDQPIGPTVLEAALGGPDSNVLTRGGYVEAVDTAGSARGVHPIDAEED